MSWTITPAYKGAAVSDPDAQTYLRAVEAIDEQPLEPAVARAVNDFVITCKASAVWNSATQLLLLSGPRTLGGSMVPLKGAVPTNEGFSSADYDRKTGLGAAGNTSKYVNSNVPKNNLSATNHALFAYGTFTNASANVRLIGHWDGSTENSLLVLDEWQTTTGSVGRAFRSASFTTGAFPFISSTSNVNCLIGSRTSNTDARIYADSNTNTSTSNKTLTVNSAQPIYYYGYNVNGASNSHSSSKLQAVGIFSPGLDATQAAALRIASANYVSSLATAIP